MSQRVGQDRTSHRVRSFFANLGPGLVTGAADDDPSGISTYSITGATFGLTQLWTVFLTFPLMCAVQIMCGRLGVTSGEGLAATIRRHGSRRLLLFSCSLLVVANVVNIAADFSGMAECLEMVTGIHERIWLPVLGLGIVAALVLWSYRRLAATFKWLTLVLFAYVGAAFACRPDWGPILRATFVPHLELNAAYLATLVGLLGTTITPYMFFWQAAQEVEEERAHGRASRRSRLGATLEEIRIVDRDVVVGMGWAGIAMYFIILTTASTLHGSGVQIESARDAAEALKPIAGHWAYLLFTLGIVGTGTLAIPVLAGSAAYATAEALHFHGSLDDRPRVGRKFYFVLALAIVLGLLLSVFQVNAMRALFVAAIVNGLLAPPLVLIVTNLTSDPAIMGERTSGPLLRGLGYATFALMSLASVLMLGSWLLAGR